MVSMTHDTSVLMRKLRSRAPARVAGLKGASATRAVRLALARGADRRLGLPLAISGVSEEDVELETMVESLPANALRFALLRPESGVAAGVVTLSPDLCAAMVEIQTMGMLSSNEAPSRPLTGADAELSRPLLEGFLQELGSSASALPLLAQLAALEIGATLPEARSVGLVFDPGPFRIWRLPTFIGGSERKGEVCVALRRGEDAKRPEDSAALAPDWSDAFAEALGEAPAELDAVLCRLDMTLGGVEELRVGQMLPLAGTTVQSVRMEGPGGVETITARLGQLAGRRAVRIEVPGPATLDPAGSVRTAAAAVEHGRAGVAHPTLLMADTSAELDINAGFGAELETEVSEVDPIAAEPPCKAAADTGGFADASLEFVPDRTDSDVAEPTSQDVGADF